MTAFISLYPFKEIFSVYRILPWKSSPSLKEMKGRQKNFSSLSSSMVCRFKSFLPFSLIRDYQGLDTSYFYHCLLLKTVVVSAVVKIGSVQALRIILIFHVKASKKIFSKHFLQCMHMET